MIVETRKGLTERKISGRDQRTKKKKSKKQAQLASPGKISKGHNFGTIQKVDSDEGGLQKQSEKK